MSTRRAFIGTLASVLLTALPVAATAQQPKPVPRIGLLNYRSCSGQDAISPAFLKGLTDLGYVIGTTVTVECRSAGGDYGGFNSAAAELVRLKVDVIVALNHSAARAAKEATNRIPIVMVASGDPVGSGLVASLARPGGNATGLTYYATELTAKRLELLKDMVPNLSRVAVLDNPDLSYLPFLGDTKTAGQALRLRLQVFQVRTSGDIDRAFAASAQQGAQAVFILPDLMMARQASQIAELALRHRLPTMAWSARFAESGGLAAYTANYAVLFQRAAVYVDKILRGAKPSDLPVEQPTTFQLVVNLKTAKALGLTIPPSVLGRADEVIQ